MHGGSISRIPDEVARMPELKSISLLENPIAAEELERARALAPQVKLA